jgi:hypothetical protein
MASFLSSVIDWATGLSVGFAALLPCKALSVGLPELNLIEFISNDDKCDGPE